MTVRVAMFLGLWLLFFGVPAIAQNGSERFVDNRDGTITDSKTGLVWQKKDSYHELKKPLSWYDALDYAEQKNMEKFAGYMDWRLPTMEELRALWDSSLPNLTKDEEQIGLPKIFESGGSYYLWSSNERGLDLAWYFGLGQSEDYFNLKETNDLGQGARLVRIGK